jgi:hypothetical protein
MARPGQAGRGEARQGRAGILIDDFGTRRGVAWPGSARLGAAWRGEVGQGRAGIVYRFNSTRLGLSVEDEREKQGIGLKKQAATMASIIWS